jgi:hypothetical protein
MHRMAVDADWSPGGFLAVGIEAIPQKDFTPDLRE